MNTILIVFFLVSFIGVIIGPDPGQLISTPGAGLSSGDVNVDAMLNEVFDFITGHQNNQKPLATVRKSVRENWPAIQTEAAAVHEHCGPLVSGNGRSTIGKTVVCHFIYTYINHDPGALNTEQALIAGYTTISETKLLTSVFFILTETKGGSLYGMQGGLFRMKALLKSKSKQCYHECATIELNPEQRPLEQVLVCLILIQYKSSIFF